MRASSKRVAALAAVLMVGLFATGCRKAKARSDFHTEEEAKPEAAFVDGVSADTIKLATVASLTGAQAGLGTEVYRGAMAYFLEVNSKGGIHGRKIELAPIDDKYSADGAEQGAEKAMSDGVFAIFGSTGTEPSGGILKVLGSAKYDSKKAFLWGSTSGAEVLREGALASHAFNIRGSLKGAGKDITEAYAAAGFKKVAIVAQDDGFGKSAAAAAKKAAEERGLQVVAELSVSKALKPDTTGAANGPNANDAVNKARAAGAEAVVLATTYNPASVFIRDAREHGWNAPAAVMGTPDTALRYLNAQEKKTGKRMTNGFLGCVNVPPVGADLPAVREYRELIDKRNPTLPSEIADPNYRPLHYASSSLEGFIMAKVFGEALERAGRNLTRESFRTAAESIRGWDPGVGQRINFGPGDNQGFDGIWLAGVKSEEFVLLADMKKYLTDKPEPVVIALDDKDTKTTATTPAAANAKTAPATKKP